MDKELFTITDLNEAIKKSKKVRKTYNKVKLFEEWLTYQGKGLKDMIKNNG